MAEETVKIIFNNFLKVSGEAAVAAGLAVSKATLDIEAQAKTEMSGGKSGRVYKRAGKEHRASAPGEAPAVDQGDLIGSIQSHMETPHTGVVEVTSDHAAVQELGGIKMAARPYLRPAVDAVEPSFVEAMEHIVGNK